MDVGELLSFQPDKPALKGKGKRPALRDERDADQPPVKLKKKEKFFPEDEEEDENDKIMELVENGPEPEALDDVTLKKMILQFEKKVLKNQEMRIKFPDNPEKFMESEVDLNDILHEMHVIATVPDLYHILVDLNSVQSLLQLLSHDNTDISIAVVELLQELTDVDTLTDHEDGGADALIDALIEGQITALLVQNLDRLDEAIKEEADGVYNTLGLIENMVEFRSELCVEAAQQGLLTWLLRRLRAKLPFDNIKQYAAEVLAILVQNSDENRRLLGEMDGIDVLLQQLAVYKKHDPTTSDEIEFMENVFDSMCSTLMLTVNREKFLKGEGLQLMNLMLRERKMSRTSAIKVLNHAMGGQEGQDNCQKFVDILGLRSIFPVFMKTPKSSKKGTKPEEIEEHVASIISSMLKNTSGAQRHRLLNKFVENDHEKVDRMMELHFKYLERVRLCDQQIERDKAVKQRYNVGDPDDEDEDRNYLKRLDAGLFTLQLIDYIMLEVCQSGSETIKTRVLQILNMRGGSTKTIRNIMREYASNIGDVSDPEAREIEQNRILDLVDQF